MRYIACSNWRAERIRAANDYARAHGLQGFVADQMLWNLAKVEPDHIGDKTMVPMTGDLHAYHRRANLAAIPYSSQANGLFQKLARSRPKQDATIRGPDALAEKASRLPMSPGALRMVDLDETKHRLKRIEHLSSTTGLTITQIVLAYLRSQPFPTVPVVGCRTPEQLADSLQAAGCRLLSPAQVDYLERGQQD